MRAGSTIRMAGLYAVAGLLLLASAWPAEAQVSERSRAQVWLNSAREKALEEAEKLVEKIEKLSKLLKEDTREGMPEDVEKRVQEMLDDACELRGKLQETNVNELSFSVVVSAADLEDRGKALKNEFGLLRPRKRRNRFRDLADDIEHHAESVKKKMQYP